ncbi:MAG: hypothetical protein AAB693_01795 [Patescibacteria group bacterium]
MSKKIPKKEGPSLNPQIIDDDDCEICKLTKTGNVSLEELQKAFSLQNFLNDNFPKDQDDKK